ncbi:MAG: HAD-IIIA family hydrolase [Bdellovibrionaceae bacterium]|nr:HAD-IIIA family hydrolase [Pseudobdellovibrionaceae bacterium]
MKNDKYIEGFGDQPCLFLDRDGVIVPDIPYNTDLTKVSLKPGIVEILEKAHALGYWVAVVSNQSGLGRGFFSWTDYRRVHQKICALLAERGQWLDLALCAPFYEGTEFTPAKERPHYRKPDVGMFAHAQSELGVNFSNSIIIGDSATDLIPAFRCGVRKAYLVESKKMDGELRVLAEFQKTNMEFQFQVISHFSEVVF